MWLSPSWVPQAGNAFLPRQEVPVWSALRALAHGEPARSRPGRSRPVSGLQRSRGPIHCGRWFGVFLGFSHYSIPTALASCLRGLKHQSRKLHNRPGRPPPRWLMGGAVRCRGLAFDLRVSSCALPMRLCACVCAWTCVNVCVCTYQQTVGRGPGSRQEEARLDPIRVLSFSDIRIFMLTGEDAQMAACVWG